MRKLKQYIVDDMPIWALSAAAARECKASYDQQQAEQEQRQDRPA